MRKAKPTPVPVPPVDCALDTPTPITVGQKLKLMCKTDGIIPVSTQTKIEFKDLSPVAEKSLQFLGEPLVVGGNIEQAITSYRVGNHEFLGIKVIIAEKEYPVSKQTLSVTSVLPQDKQAPTPFPAHEPFEVSAPWWWWAIWGALLLLLIAIVVREFFKWKKRREILLTQPEAGKPQTPQEKFQSALRKLESKGLHQKGEYKAFALELTQILKVTLGEHYRISAEDMTSEELMETLQRRQKVFFNDHGSLLQTILSALDQIKFAKVETTSGDCLVLLDNVNRIGNGIFGGAT
jgi:hypothetical protein